MLRRAFPGVKIVCGAVDDEMKEGWLDVEGYHGEGNPEDHPRKVWVMQPGMGQIGKFSRSEEHTSELQSPNCISWVLGG